MAETPPKRKANPKRDQQSVLGTLPASRPERIGRPRREAAATSAKRPPAAANGAATRPRAKRAARPTAAAKRAAAPAPPPRTSTRPTAVRPASPPLRSTRVAGAPPPKPIGAPTGTELVTTTIRAAGELAQIGFTVGGQMLKRTIDRIPRP
jgi:hypothetical protein